MGCWKFSKPKGTKLFHYISPNHFTKKFCSHSQVSKKEKKTFFMSLPSKNTLLNQVLKKHFNLALLTFLMSVVDALHSRLLLRKLNSLVCYSRSVLLICRATEGCNRAHRVNCSVLLIPAREFSRFFAVSQFWN